MNERNAADYMSYAHAPRTPEEQQALVRRIRPMNFAELIEYFEGYDFRDRRGRKLTNLPEFLILAGAFYDNRAETEASEAEPTDEPTAPPDDDDRSCWPTAPEFE